MLLSHAPPLPFLLTTLFHYHHRHCYRALSSSIHLFSKPLSITNHSLLHSRRSSILPMNGASIVTHSSSSPEHVVGDWFSVPSLLLRNHTFTVPLDYSRGLQSSPKITVFVREVVAGNSSYSLNHTICFPWIHSCVKVSRIFILFMGFACLCVFLWSNESLCEMKERVFDNFVFYSTN
jgi:hypothetical protein